MAESEHETSHLAHVMHDMEKDFEFEVGMIFSNELEAYHKYVAYAIGKGFGVRKAKIVRNTKGEIIRRTFVCNCEGHSGSSSDQEMKFERFEIRCGCLARIKFKVDNGIYEVIEYVSGHNHAFMPEDQKHLLRCGRMISDTCKGVLIDTGTGGTTTYKFLANEAGGSKNSGFILRDCQNILHTEKSNRISGGDCQSLMNHFNCMQMQNPMFFYAVQVDQDGRLTNFFWRDSLSKFDYDCFGDVLVFDTTYRTKKYDIICAPFVGVNHHGKTTLFGCAFLLDETVDSFIWLFETFLKSMGNKAPKIMFTDEDQAIGEAIKTVFPNTQHRLCTWHIGKNADQNIPHLYHKPGFKEKYFSVLMYGCRSEDEFESIWRQMEEEWHTKNNNWLRRLYDLRHKWSSAFGRDSFTCGIGSSQRSESTSYVFRHILTKTLTLVEVVHHYEKQLTHLREIESRDDFNSRGKPKLLVRNNDILTHAASLYTRAIFERFNVEFLQTLCEHISSTAFDGLVYVYTIKCEGHQREHVVRFDAVDFSVSCECKLFESKGWLCRHALRVLNENESVMSIPSSYILKRWTKGAKQGIVNDEFHQMSPGPSRFNRFCMLMQQSFEVMSLGAEDENTMRIVMKYLEKTKAKILAYKSSVAVTDDASDDDDNETSLCEISISDPLQRKGKGTSCGKLKSSSEKKKKNSKKGTPPTRIKSQELIAQATHHETHFQDYLRNINQIGSAFYPSNIHGPAINLNFHNQMRPPYIMPPGIMNGYCAFPTQMQSPYIIPPGIMNGFPPFTSQMLGYHNKSHKTISSQGSSNSFQHPRMNELNKGDSG